MSAGWQDVLDEQLDLIRFWRTDAGQDAGRMFGASMTRVEREVGHDTPDGWAEIVPTLQLDSLLRADPFYVDDDMMTLVEAAAETFQPEPLAATDLLTPFTFIVLPRPLYMHDRHGTKLAYRAILLRSISFAEPLTGRVRAVLPAPGQVNPDEDTVTMWGEGVMLSLYSHILDEDEQATPYLDAEEPEWRERLIAEQGTPYSLLHVTPWVFGDEYPGDDDLGRVGWWRQIQALLRLALQTVSDRHEMRPARGAARRWKRMLHEDKYVTVIRLRRPRHKREGEERDVEWSHRWIVSGHWRNAWFASLGIHRQIWIGAYVKGPEDRPLLVRRTRAFELVR